MSSGRLMALATIAGMVLWSRAAGAQGVGPAPTQPAPAEFGEATAPDLAVASVDELLVLLAHPSPSRRVEAIRALGARRDARAVPQLAALVRTEPSAEIRGWVLRAIAEIDDPVARDAVAGAARDDPDDRVRSLAAQLATAGGGSVPWGACAPCPPCGDRPAAAASGAATGPETLDDRVAALVRRQEQRDAMDRVLRTPGTGSSKGMLIFTAVVDSVGIPLMLTGTAIPEFGFSAPFIAPAGLADTAFMTGWQQSIASRGVRIERGPMAASWVLTTISFVGSWVGSHIQLAWNLDDEAMVGAVAALMAISSIAEAVNIFIRGIVWRRAVTRAYEGSIREQLGVDELPETE